MVNTFLIVCKMWALEINYSSMIIILIKRIRNPSLTSLPNCDIFFDHHVRLRMIMEPGEVQSFVFLLGWYNELGILHCTYLECQVVIFKRKRKPKCILFLRRPFYLYKQYRALWKLMQLIMLHFILAFTVCKTTRLGVSPNTKGNTI